MPRKTPGHNIVSILLPTALVDQIEQWRAARVEPPSQTAAIRWLIRLGLRESVKQEEKA